MTKRLAAVILGAGALMSINLHAQTPDQPANVAFDVISIRPSPKDARGITGNRLTPSGLYTVGNISVRTLISFAYGSGLTVVGAPNWLDTALFDISAKTEIANPHMAYPQLIKSLLADRFKLTAHMETRELPVYLLVKAASDGRLGPLLRPAKGCNPKAPINIPAAGPVRSDQLPTCNSMYGPTRQSVGNMPITALIHNLPPSFIGRAVLDRTGLTGNFDWDLQWENDQTAASAGVTIFSALQEQLGLKLEPGKGPVEVLVIDHVEMPTLDQ